MKEPTCKWSCIINFKQQQHSQILYPWFKYEYLSLERSYKAPVKKNLMRTVLFKTNQLLKLSIILSLLYISIIFIIYYTIHFFLRKPTSLPTKFRKRFLYNNENTNVSSVNFDVYFHLWCVNVASNNSTLIILIIKGRSTDT